MLCRTTFRVAVVFRLFLAASGDSGKYIKPVYRTEKLSCLCNRQDWAL